MSNLLLSFELLYLMGWLLENEKKTIKGLIKRAIDDGLALELDQVEGTPDNQSNEALQNTFLDFIAYMEDTLIDTLEEVKPQEEVHDNLMLSLKGLNVNSIDPRALITSLKQAESELSKLNVKSPQQSKKVLLQKLLKNWKPENSDLN